MKVTKEDYGELRRAIMPSMMMIEAGPARVRYDQEGLSAERRRWDAFWNGTALADGGQDLRARIVAGYNDDHIDTALRRIQKEANL